MSSGNQSKVSPRKFSEKIALLNKKEREGNAKFEEIIKEVQGATKIIHSTPNYTSTSPVTELDFMDDSKIFDQRNICDQTRSVDSQEEIEKVYENLIKSVDQDYEEEQRSQSKTDRSIVDQCAPMQHQQLYDINGRQAFRSSSAGPDRTSDQVNSVSLISQLQQPTQPVESSTINFVSRQQKFNNERLHHQLRESPQLGGIDLNNNNHHHTSNLSHYVQSQLDRSHISGLGPLSTYASTSYLSSQNNQTNCIPEPGSGQISQNTCRPRVVSFGSATSNTHRHASIISHNINVQSQTVTSNQASNVGAPILACHQSNYLNEPSCDRSRQKSCSDPALHAVPDQMVGSTVASCNSENRIALTASAALTTPTDLNMSSVDQFIEDQQYRCQQFSDPLTGVGTCSLPCCSLSNQQNVTPNTKPVHIPTQSHSNLESSGSLSTQTDKYQSQNNHNDVPGIKICAIEDESSNFTGAPPALSMRDGEAIIGSCANEQSTRDRSLPDISNLEFGSSSSTSRHMALSDCHIERQTGDIQLTSVDPQCIRQLFADSCQAIDGSWPSSYAECSRVDQIDMDLQMDEQSETSYQLPYSRPNNWPHQFNNAQKMNNISNSDCGLTLAGQQDSHGYTMVYVTNDIMRSRSHSNIDYLARHNKMLVNGRSDGDCLNDHDPQDTHLQLTYNANGLIFGQDCIDTYIDRGIKCLNAVTKLSDVTKQASPQGSLSNMDSPQSDMNSPGSNLQTHYGSLAPR